MSGTLSKKPWKVGQRVTTGSGNLWGTITKVVDRNKNSSKSVATELFYQGQCRRCA